MSAATDHVLKVAVVEGVDGQAFNVSFDEVEIVVAGGHPRITLLSADTASAPIVLLDLGQLQLCGHDAVSNCISCTCRERRDQEVRTVNEPCTMAIASISSQVVVRHAEGEIKMIDSLVAWSAKMSAVSLQAFEPFVLLSHDGQFKGAPFRKLPLVVCVRVPSQLTRYQVTGTKYLDTYSSTWVSTI